MPTPDHLPTDPGDPDHPGAGDRVGDPDHPGAGDRAGPVGHADAAAPFGLPVLAELPELAGALDRLVDADRAIAAAIGTLVLLDGSGEVERTAGVPVDRFLAAVARRTGSDVRMLRCAVRACRRFPSLHHGFADGAVSWSQLRAVALVTDRVDVVDDPTLWPQPPAPTLLLRAELDTFLGRSGQGAQLLTTLAGGVMHVDATTARRLAEHVHGLRLIVTDGGRVVGVGRRTTRPPRFLVDAIRAVHDTCSAPGCDRSVLTCQVDHAAPSSRGGPTDVANCGPLCDHDNREKERAGWRARGEPDGTRHWHHPRSGLRVTTHPATKRPPPRPPDDPLRTPGRRSGATVAAPRVPPWPPPPPDDPDG
jgi:hypothetical protein